MGNGQCPECHGCGPSFGDQNSPETVGHKAHCVLAEALGEVNGRVLYQGYFTPTAGQLEVLGKRREWLEKWAEGFNERCEELLAERLLDICKQPPAREMKLKE